MSAARIAELEQQLQNTQAELDQLRGTKSVKQMSSEEFLAHRASKEAASLDDWRPTGPAVDATKLTPEQWAYYLRQLENKSPNVGPVQDVKVLSPQAFLDYRCVLRLGGDPL